MRVATRRLRGDIGTFEPLIDAPWGSALVGELRWLGDLLGAVRDRDVQLASLASRRGPAGRPDAAAHRHLNAREAAREELMGALEGSRYLDLLERLVQAARDPLLTAEAQRPASDVVPDLLSGTANRTRGRLKDVLQTALIGRTTRPESAPRTCATRPRRSVRSSPAARGAFATSRLLPRPQDVLGAHQDALVMQHQVQETMNVHRKDAAFAFAAGRYAERLEARRRDLRAGYPPVRDELARIKRWGRG